MRLFASTIALSMTIALLGFGSSASLHAADPGACQVSDCSPGGCEVPQGAAACEGGPSVCATLFDRFVNPNKCEPHWGFRR